MMQIQMPEVVDQVELEAWRASIRKPVAASCPVEVRQFIDALELKLPDFGQIGKERTFIAGWELMLAGMKEYNGEQIRRNMMYELPYPKMIALDHHTAMHRIFTRQGKEGLINYVKNKVSGTELERALQILNVHVFHRERKEFVQVMDEIIKARKIS